MNPVTEESEKFMLSFFPVQKNFLSKIETKQFFLGKTDCFRVYSSYPKRIEKVFEPNRENARYLRNDNLVESLKLFGGHTVIP